MDCTICPVYAQYILVSATTKIKEQFCRYLYMYIVIPLLDLIFQNKFSCQKCLPSPLPLLGDGMPQQFRSLINGRIQLHHWGANTAAQQLILPLCRGSHDTIMS